MTQDYCFTMYLLNFILVIHTFALQVIETIIIKKENQSNLLLNFPVRASFLLLMALKACVCPLVSLRDYVQYWAERGVEVVGWTVNTAVEKSFYQSLLKIGYITDSLLEDCDSHY